MSNSASKLTQEAIYQQIDKNISEGIYTTDFDAFISDCLSLLIAAGASEVQAKHAYEYAYNGDYTFWDLNAILITVRDLAAIFAAR